MHYLDIVIVIIIAASMIEGVIQGFIYEICSLIGLIAGFFLALNFFVAIAGYLAFIPLADWILKIIAFIAILITVNITLRIVGKILRKLMKTLFMGWVDRVLGIVFGLLRGAAFVVFITVILLVTPASNMLEREAPSTKFLAPAIELAKPFIDLVTEKKPDLQDAI
ncbi:CvpA family protein [bacterium]|nr:CvpA family protein [bacterium]MBU1651062.1 CvpA family protein [bacterium]MBU1881360.1 CvpA family protein [bacterium]